MSFSHHRNKLNNIFDIAQQNFGTTARAIANIRVIWILFHLNWMYSMFLQNVKQRLYMARHPEEWTQLAKVHNRKYNFLSVLENDCIEWSNSNGRRRNSLNLQSVSYPDLPHSIQTTELIAKLRLIEVWKQNGNKKGIIGSRFRINVPT